MPFLARRDPEEIDPLMTIDNLDLLTAPEIRRRGGLLLSGHLGNWELLALGAARASNQEFLIPVKQQNDHGFMNRLRERFGNRTTDLSDRSMLQIMRTLADGGMVALLADQSPGPRDPIVSFFGLPTRFFSGPARLALRYRPEVIVGFAERTDAGVYHTTLRTLRYDDLEGGADAEQQFMQRYADILQNAIERNPAAWVWHHRRWKHSPEVSYE